MEEFESTTDAERSLISTVCVVYDERDGRVIHVHEFVGDGTGLFGGDGEEDRSRMALETARQHTAPEALRTLHVPRDVRLESEKVYRVDLVSQTLVVREPKRPSLRDLIERRRNL
jgi:hypothetical protein